MSIANKKFSLVADCPFCGAKKVTFDILENSNITGSGYRDILFTRCRFCSECSNFLVNLRRERALNTLEKTNSVVNALFSSIVLQPPVFPNSRKCPDFCPEPVVRAFDEATRCFGVSAWNASGAMFRRVIDLATKSLITENNDNKIGDPNFISWKTYKDLRLRIDWLLDRDLLDKKLSPLIDCIREDGNDAAHAIEELDDTSCLDLQDFTVAVLETVFTEPGRISESIRRRNERRGKME